MSRIKTIIALAITALLCSVATAGAAHHYLITSTKQIKPNVMRALKGHNGAEGPRGFNGTQGIQGPAGPGGSVVTVAGGHVFLTPGGYGSARADCPAGMTVVGTGFNTGIGNADFVVSYGTFVGGFFDDDVSINIEAYVQAICASGMTDGGGAARAVGPSQEQRFAQDVAAAKATR